MLLNWLLWYKFRITPQTYKPVILVTGCSSGIGLAIIRLLRQHPEYRVVATAREQSLEILKKEFSETESFWITPLDVANSRSRDSIIDRIYSRWGGVDILINNAGICYRSVLEEMLDEDEHLQMETNYFGPVSLIRKVLPYMRGKGRGKIINISSVSGILSMPTMASYSASKSALEGAMEALWYELRPFGVDVCLIQPGFVRSPSFERVKYTVNSKYSIKNDTPYSDIYHSMEPFVARFMKRGIATPESVAALVLKNIKTIRPTLWAPASLDANILYYLKVFLPRGFLLPILFLMLPKSLRWSKRYSKRRSWWGTVKWYFKGLVRSFMRTRS